MFQPIDHLLRVRLSALLLSNLGVFKHLCLHLFLFIYFLPSFGHAVSLIRDDARLNSVHFLAHELNRAPLTNAFLTLLAHLCGRLQDLELNTHRLLAF